MKYNKGIMLIALVVTIIVLLLLAGISISMLSGNNSILKRANDAVNQTGEAQKEEELKLEILGSLGNDGILDANTLKNNLENIGATVSGSNFPLTVEYSEKTYQITSDGKVNDIGNIAEILTEEDYLIVMEASKTNFQGKSNVGTIQEFKALVEAGTFDYNNVYLYENIDLGGSASNAWTPIGTDTNKFNKIFDGRGYSISGLYISGSSQEQGLFKKNAGTIKNVTINGQINCSANLVGAIVGFNEGIIEKCTSNTSIIGNEYVGGISGDNSPTGTIRNCTSNSPITGAQVVGGISGGTDGAVIGCTNNGNVQSTSENESTVTQYLTGTGGIVGSAVFGSVSNCCNLKEIRSVSYGTGGIIGNNYNSIIQYCYNEGTVQGTEEVGGIVGFVNGNTKEGTLIRYCYNRQNISAYYNIGGIIGNIYRGKIENCYNTGNVTSIDNFTEEKIGGICATILSEVDITNCYILDSLNIEIVGYMEDNPLVENSSKKTETEMKSDNFVTILNSTENNFKKSSTYPILSWQ